MGAPAKTTGSYSFVQDPICDYPETVTISNLPTFLTNNEATADFTVSALSDLSLIGEYTITVRSEIMVPTDYTKSSFNTIFVEYNFPFRVQPCVVSSYSRNLFVSSISQNVGAPAKITGAYSFV